MAAKDDIGTKLRELVQTERRARELHAALRKKPRSELMPVLKRAVHEAVDGKGDAPELALLCVARLLGEFETADAVDGLIEILGCNDADARLEAGEQLEGIAADHFRVVAERISRVVERSGKASPALLELPYVLAETQHPDATALLGDFLGHEDGDVVAAAIEALTLLGDPSAVELLEPLREDKRTSHVVGDDERERFEATVGELACEAIEMLSDGTLDDAEPPQP